MSEVGNRRESRRRSRRPAASPVRRCLGSRPDLAEAIYPIDATPEAIRWLTDEVLPEDLDDLVMAPDGSDLIRLTHGSGDYSSVSNSPDGSRLALVRLDLEARGRPDREGIYVANADGSDAIEVFRSTLNPQSLLQLQWSPDGQKLGFILRTIPDGGGSEADWSYRLWVMGSDGSDPHPVSDEQITSFSWSPSGDRFAVTIENVRGVHFVDDIFVLPIDGSAMTRLTNQGASRGPIWSPDGRLIAYTEGWASDGPHTMLMRADGSDIRPLPLEHGGWSEPLAWNPDSTHLLVRGLERSECSTLLISLAGEISPVLRGSTGLAERSSGETAGGDPCPASATWFAGTPDVVQSSQFDAQMGPGDDGMVRSGGSYDLFDLAVEFPTGENAAAKVSFSYTWTSSTFPGEASCTFTLVDEAGSIVGEEQQEFAALQRRSDTHVLVPVREGTPVAAEAQCGPGIIYDGPWNISNLSVQGDRVLGDLQLAGADSYGTAACAWRWHDALGAEHLTTATLTTGSARETHLARTPDDLPAGGTLEIRCETYRSSDQLDRSNWLPWTSNQGVA